MTFDEASHPYLKGFGYPDQTNDFEFEGKDYIQWYYYEEDVIVEFVCPKENIETGWEISFALCLDPLKYYQDKTDNEYEF